MTDRVGQQLGNYRLLRLLGRGGFADVYLGEHTYLKKPAALKVLHLRLDEQDTTQFLREAQTLAGLDHPHIVRVLDFAVQEGMPFLVMDYAVGGTLRTRHPAGTRLPLDQVIAYIIQVAFALQYAHHQRLIHCDVKPENMLLGTRKEVLLSDFGLAMLTTHTYSASTQAMDPSMAGTIPYLAPEQLQGKPQPASDQYALGVVVYEWLCGKRPFSGSPIEIAMQHLSIPPPPLREQVADLLPSVEQVVMCALAKEPQLRFASVHDFAIALQHAHQEAMSPRSPAALASDHPDEAEQEKSSLRNLPRGTVTLLFTDIEGSMDLLQQVGDRYASLLMESRHLLRTAFHEWNGHEVDTQGDAFFVAFARSTDAISAAVVAQRALAHHTWPEGTMVRVRMGLHTGEPALMSEGYVGLDVHRTARIMAAGHGGQVLLSQATCMLVEHDLPGGVSLRDLGEHRLKDLQGPQRLFQLVIADLPADFPPLNTLDAHPNNLPIQPTPFIGREQELSVVRDLLGREEVRLLTLTGPGGTGKTRLGLQVAAELSERFVHGVFFVDLAPLSDPDLVLSTIAQTLGTREVAGQSLLERLSEELQPKQVLLLLDNFEQVVSAALVVADLLAACPQLKVLVTSRMVLHVRAEYEFAVPPLALPDPTHLRDLAALSQSEAVALFLQRAQAVKSDFQMTTANARAVAEICIRLDGLPLAIELAAARIKLLSPPALLARLAHRLQVLTSGARDVPVRQQTLRNTIAWSYHLLDAQEQRLFRQLSVFVGGCTLETAEAVCAVLGDGDGAGPVLDGVASLIDKSLLQHTEQVGEEGKEPRLRLLETIREYGLECLTASGETEVTRQAHAAYYLRLAEEGDPELLGPQQAVWLKRLEREHDNLRAALRWSLEQGETGQSQEMALRLSAALWWFWFVRGHRSEGRAFLEQALAASEGVIASVRAKVLIVASQFVLDQGDMDRAEALAEESLALSRKLGYTWGIGYSFNLLGEFALMRGNFAAARLLNEEALALQREAGDLEQVTYSLAGLADLASLQGEYTRGRTLLEESLAIHRELRNTRGITDLLLRLAEVLFVSQGDQATVHALLEESLTLSRELDDKSGIASCYCLAGRLALNQGDTATARRLSEESIVLRRELGYRQGIAQSLSLLARVEAHQGDYAAARALSEESLAITRKLGAKLDIALGLEGLAGVVAAQGEPAWAARLWGAAEALREAVSAPLAPVDRASYEQSITTARTQLGVKAFAAAWAEGRTLTLERALAAQGPVTLPQQLATGPAPAPPAKTPSYPAGLTEREVEVLRLVAQGLTNAQIAEQLIVSPHTVHAHVRSIHSKLGVTSSSAVTRYAIEHRLV